MLNKLRITYFFLLLLWSASSTQVLAQSDCLRALNKVLKEQTQISKEYSYESFANGEALVHMDQFFEIFNRATNISGANYEYVAGVLREVLSYEVFAAKNLNGQYVGYTSVYRGVGHHFLEGTIFQGRQLSYMATAMIDPLYQGQGIYGKLNKLRFDVALENSPSLLFTRTQNPRVEKGLRSALNKKVAEGKLRDWKLSRIKREKAYGQLLTTEKITVDDLEIQAAFNRIDAESGDAYLLIFELSYP